MKEKNLFKHFNTLATISIIIFAALLLVGKMDINPTINNISDYSIVFVALYLIFKNYYYEYYYVAQTDKKIEELNLKIEKMSAHPQKKEHLIKEQNFDYSANSIPLELRKNQKDWHTTKQ